MAMVSADSEVNRENLDERRKATSRYHPAPGVLVTRTIKAGITLVATLGTFAIGGRADACSCMQTSACPTDLRGQIVFVATAHVEPIPASPVIPKPAEESIVTWHDDFRVSVNVTVVGQAPSDDEVRERTTLLVQRAVRGMVGQQYQIEGRSFGSSCDYRFKDGEQYLVYAHPQKDGSISTSICTRTKPLRSAAADLAYLAGEGTPGLSGTVRGALLFYDRKRPADAIKVVLERPDGERLFEIETRRFDSFAMYPVPPGPYVLSVLLNESDKALHSRVILVAPGQCPRDGVDLTVGTWEDWSSRGGPRSPY